MLTITTTIRTATTTTTTNIISQEYWNQTQVNRNDE